VEKDFFDVFLPVKRVAIEIQGWSHGYDRKACRDSIKASEAFKKKWRLIWWYPSGRQGQDELAVEHILGLLRGKPRKWECVWSAKFRDELSLLEVKRAWLAQQKQRLNLEVELNPDYLVYTKKRLNWANGLDGHEYSEML
jgi:hypothetical protein